MGLVRPSKEMMMMLRRYYGLDLAANHAPTALCCALSLSLLSLSS